MAGSSPRRTRIRWPPARVQPVPGVVASLDRFAVVRPGLLDSMLSAPSLVILTGRYPSTATLPCWSPADKLDESSARRSLDMRFLLHRRRREREYDDAVVQLVVVRDRLVVIEFDRGRVRPARAAATTGGPHVLHRGFAQYPVVDALRGVGERHRVSSGCPASWGPALMAQA